MPGVTTRSRGTFGCGGCWRRSARFTSVVLRDAGGRVLGWVVLGMALLAAMVAAALSLAGDRIAASLIASRLAAEVGRPIEFSHARLDWGSPVRLSAEDFRIPDEDASAPPVFAAERVEAD